MALGVGDTAWACTKLRALSELHDGRPIWAYVNRSQNHATVGFLELVQALARAGYSDRAPYNIWGQLPPNHRDPRWSTLDGCRGWEDFDYVLVPNGHLERGESLETWLPELRTEFDIPLNIPAAALETAELLAGERPVLVYPSGIGPNAGFHLNTWRVEDWQTTIRLLVQALHRPVTLVGANTPDDLGYRDLLLADGTLTDHVVDLVGQTSLAEYCAVIESAAVWVGLNSGGGIVSAMRHVPTVMLWSDSASPVPGVHPNNVLHTNMKTSFLAPWQLDSYRTLSFGSADLTAQNVVDKVLQVIRS
jgi:hypothetical protein